MGSIQVPTISVWSTQAASLTTLIDIPASHPGHVGSEPGVTGTGETANIVGTSGLNTTEGSSIVNRIIYFTLIQFIAGWKLHVFVTVMSIMTIFIISAAHNTISTSVVVLVTHSVAAIIIGTEPKPS